MITNGKKWYYLAVKGLSALLRGTTSKHYGDFYWLNCFHSYSAKGKPKDVCEKHDYFHVEMSQENNRKLI